MHLPKLTLSRLEIGFLISLLSGSTSKNEETEEWRADFVEYLIDTLNGEKEFFSIPFRLEDAWEFVGALFALANSSDHPRSMPRLRQAAGLLTQLGNHYLWLRAEQLEAKLKVCRPAPPP